MDDEIRRVLREHGKLPCEVEALDDDADLFEAGLTSHASINVMLALEEVFDVEFPEPMLRKSTFESIGAIRRALITLTAAGVPS